jgi:hypothetical protein
MKDSATPAHEPPATPSDESTSKQLELARRQGDALQQAIDEMTQHEAHGGEKRAGEYLVGFAVENAEGLWWPEDGKLKWREPQQENAHLEIAVRDGEDGRLVPQLKVYLTLIDSAGRVVGTHEQPFLWHPWLNHYGRNWIVPAEGDYSVRVRIEAPLFPRHDKKNGCRFAEPVEVEFSGVHIKPGRKIS